MYYTDVIVKMIKIPAQNLIIALMMAVASMVARGNVVLLLP